MVHEEKPDFKVTSLVFLLVCSACLSDAFCKFCFVCWVGNEQQSHPQYYTKKLFNFCEICWPPRLYTCFGINILFKKLRGITVLFVYLNNELISNGEKSCYLKGFSLESFFLSTNSVLYKSAKFKNISYVSSLTKNLCFFPILLTR